MFAESLVLSSGLLTLSAKYNEGDYPLFWREHIEKQLTVFRLPKSKTENRQSQMSYCFTISVNLTRAFFVGRCGSIVPTRPTFWPTKPLKFIFEAVPVGKA